MALTRQDVIDIIHEVIGFGHVKTSEVSDGTSTVGLTLDGAGDGAKAEASATDEELWTHGPLMFRPQDEDTTGHCEVLFYRLGDGKVVIASKDRRFQITSEKGEVIVAAMGLGTPAYVHLKPDGTLILRGNIRGGLEAAAQKMVLGDILKTVLEALTVPTAMGPSGTPINAASFSSFLSSKHKLDV